MPHLCAAHMKEGQLSTVSVKQLDDLSFEVTVNDRNSTTHLVTVQPQYAELLTAGRMPVSRLVSRSFEFLLEREPNTSILRSFDLSVIARYFPEYESTIKKL
jgi:hypothetical protein